MASYGPPVDQLLRLGKITRFKPEEWLDYRTLGIGPEQIPDLARLAVDEDLDEPDAEGDEFWAPYHARRALGLLKAESAVPMLVGVFADQDEEDFDQWITEEIPLILAMIGPPAIPELSKLLENEEATDNAREHASESLEEIVKLHPETREEVVQIFIRNLERAEGQNPSLNGYLVAGLLELQGKEAAEVIERAYSLGLVDEFLCGPWYHVWEELELEGEPPPRPQRPRRVAEIMSGRTSWRDSERRIERPVAPSPPAEKKPVETRAPEDRKDRNKVRKKLEQKAKGKGGKRR